MAEDRMLSDEILLGLIKANSGGGGGTTDYEDLNNLPKVNSVELKGNKSLSDLGIASAQSVENITNGESINNFAGVEDALSNVQILDGVVDPSGSVGKDKNLYVELSGSIPSAMKVTSLKFEVTARRGGGTGMIEYSRLGFYDADGNKYNWPQGTTWSSNVQTAENDPVGSSKMLQYSIPAITTINLPGGEYIDTSVYNLYGWNTGNYSGENCQRDPVSWKLYLSEDETNYILRDVRSNQTITTSRNTLAFKDEFNTLPPEFPSISDIFYKKGGVWLKDAFAQQSEVDAIKDGQSIDSFADVETALADVETALSGKQDTLTFDDTPTDNSNNPVKSNGIYDALATKADTDMVASDFDATASYTAGNYCIYEGKFYKFKASHSGAWSAADVDEIKIAGELSALKSGLTTLDSEVNGDATVYPYADVITISDAIPANVADCTVKIEPVQDLHGYDKPWVGGAGKNKCAQTVDGIKARNSGFTWVGKQGTAYGITVTILTDDAENVMGYNFNGTCNEGFNFSFDDASYVATESITINGCPDGAPASIEVWRSGNVIGRDSGAGVTVESGSTALAVRVESGTSMSNVVYRPMIRLSTETDATFAPYTNICPISGHTEASVTVVDDAENPTVTKTYTIALGDTIYGGTVDFDSGVMTVDRGILDLGDRTWIYYSNNKRFLTETPVTDADNSGQYTRDKLICSAFDTNSNPIDSYLTADNSICLYTNRYLYVLDKRYTNATEFKTAMTGVKVVYTLATPFTVQLTPTQIQLLKGTNTLTASTGQISVTVNGVSGSIGSLQTQATATDAALAELAADIAEQLPTAPTTDGAYVLTVTVADGTPTYSWESAS